MKATWKLVLEASRQESLLAAELYNRPSEPRRLEAYFVHMHMAWLYLFQALHQRNNRKYIYRNGAYATAPFARIDGEPKSWDLKKFVGSEWSGDDPIRKNLELTIALRNKIEHRYEEATTVATAGYAQALLLNYEATLTAWFGIDQTLSEALRFPVFIGAFTERGVAKMAALQRQLPAKTKQFLVSFESGLDNSVLRDPRYELRTYLIQKTGPKSKADLALSFVREGDLSTEVKAELANLGATGKVIVRDRLRDVANLNMMRPKEAAAQIESKVPFRFVASTHMPCAWRALKARPPAGDPHPERTLPELCVYDKAHGDWVYTSAFVEKVAAKIGTAEGFKSFLGLEPHPKGRQRSLERDRRGSEMYSATAIPA